MRTFETHDRRLHDYPDPLQGLHETVVDGDGDPVVERPTEGTPVCAGEAISCVEVADARVAIAFSRASWARVGERLPATADRWVGIPPNVLGAMHVPDRTEATTCQPSASVDAQVDVEWLAPKRHVCRPGPGHCGSPCALDGAGVARLSQGAAARGARRRSAAGGVSRCARADGAKARSSARRCGLLRRTRHARLARHDRVFHSAGRRPDSSRRQCLAWRPTASRRSGSWVNHAAFRPGALSTITPVKYAARSIFVRRLRAGVTRWHRVIELTRRRRPHLHGSIFVPQGWVPPASPITDIMSTLGEFTPPLARFTTGPAVPRGWSTEKAGNKGPSSAPGGPMVPRHPEPSAGTPAPRVGRLVVGGNRRATVERSTIAPSGGPP